jgi:hypothetical protein
MRRVWMVPACLLALGSVLRAQESAPKPEVWMMPPAAQDGRSLRELFAKPEEWRETRAKVDVLGYADHLLHKQFTDDELRAWLPLIGKWGLKLGLEVGAVKEWGKTGQGTFDAQRPMWDRFQALGGRIHALAMDEPLCCVRNALKKPDEYAVEETARFVALVRQHYPEVRIGDVEPYPSVSLDDLLAWLDALQARLKKLNVRGLDFFRVDVDWVHFIQGPRGSWREVKKLEEACRARGIPFSLIYWAADYPHLQRLGLADDASWYVSILRQGQDYALVGGRPDEYVIESWVGAPSAAVPEKDEWTFTRSVRDFCERFVKARPAGPPGKP